MKKMILTLLFLGIFFALAGCQALLFPTDTTQTISTTTLYSTTESSLETTALTTTTDLLSQIQFDDFDDLVDQIYAIVYADLYAELYQELIESDILSEAVYEQIYAEVENRFDVIMNESEIRIFVDALQMQLLEVADLAKRSVVGITSYLDLDGQSLGSGVIYRYDETSNTYFVITNEHVVEGGNNFKTVFYDGSKVTATLLGTNALIDIAILSFSGEGVTTDLAISELGDSSSTAVGSLVIAAGNPKGYDFYGSVTMGILSGVDRNVDSSSVGYIQHDASINSGNSGGPLYNLQGEVIGINVLKIASIDIEGMGFAIPINTVKTVIASIESDLP